jgi:hypothetical protein
MSLQILDRSRMGAGALAVLVAGLMSAPAHAVLKHKYTFNDNTANDSQGSANGTLVGGPTFTFDGQINLDGIDDYVDLPGATININAYSAVTLEAWFTINATPAWQRLYDFGDTNAGNLGRNYIFYSPSSGGNDNRAVISDADPGFNSEQMAAGGPTLATGIEHHIVVTIANGGDMTLYRNGVQTGTVALTKSLASVSNVKALLGESTYPGDANFNGRIDEFRIYDTALTPTQVLASYNAGQTFKPTLVLDVNPNTGAVSMRNATASPLTIDNYAITSLAGGLNFAGWNSFSDQNLDPVNTGTGVGESWDEAGGSGPNALGESFLKGSTTIAPGASKTLGNAYNAALNTADLRFQYSLTSGEVIRSAVSYTVIDADFNNDGFVNGTDFILQQRNMGLASGATNAQGDTDGNGVINAVDLANWKARYGLPPATAASAAVPEPATCVGLLIAVAALAAARRKAL